MKRQHLIPALTIAVVAAAGLSLPATASADNIKHGGATVQRYGDHRHEVIARTAPERHRSDTRSYDHARRTAPRYWQDQGRHIGQQHRHVYRHEHGQVVRYEPLPVVRYEPRYEYRPVVRYEPRRDDDIRVRISYDLHL